MTLQPWSQSAYGNAYWFAARAHRGQQVPGTDISYLLHVSLVCMEVMAGLRVEKDCNEDLAVQCALLHDTVEDTDVTLEDLEREFGGAVARGVAALTKDQSLAKELRMADSLRRILAQPCEIAMVKLADRITNLQPPPAHWSREKIVSYRAEALQIHEALGGASAFLSARLLERLETYGR